jgi:phenylalanyl-tRNA synthetase alpha chain
MKSTIDTLVNEINSIIISSADELERFRLKFLSKKGSIAKLFDDFKNLPHEQKKEIGALLNKMKSLAQTKFDDHSSILNPSSGTSDSLDLTLPGDSFSLGARHPLSIIRNEIVEIFSRLGFVVSLGPEIDDDWHVFTALNFPLEHPARDMQDTFFLDESQNLLLRTHTSSVQIRAMENQQPPIKIIMPGRVFRNEAISARAHCIFHQIEGLYIDKNVSFADLKQTLLYFAKEMFGHDTQIRLRPSFFPFTEPSAEMDISCTICGGNGCGICKHSGWVEILGCGMVDPNVLENTSIDSKAYTGFAFGMGIERITMLKYQINDIRLFFENDIRFLKQFSGVL